MVLVAVSFVLTAFWVNVKFGLSGPALFLVSSFFACLLAQNYGPWTNNTVTIVLTPTLFFSVPGGLLAKYNGAMDLATGDVLLIELDTILVIVQASVGVWVGLGLASLLVNPFPKPRVCVCGKEL
ncbi:hypothetical protein A1O3_07375 [Capronia epimyces CBS 606.96]|uniref:Uncharacterized protein n=1 Tax=Capronia epimyces CBS 606.96 TaxID=1182542 RepID=W9XKN1_9EURO|nr:uncharacterized protein A1O3_07375 [Capronia epimyces CBS 606.96]EXJ81087.1 hypothetical protein A1O3_07375 [Capronia epimyces CBS 606.96]